jgi:O-antigen ligase
VCSHYYHIYLHINRWRFKIWTLFPSLIPFISSFVTSSFLLDKSWWNMMWDMNLPVYLLLISSSSVHPYNNQNTIDTTDFILLAISLRFRVANSQNFPNKPICFLTVILVTKGSTSSTIVSRLQRCKSRMKLYPNFQCRQFYH